jgi:hypothetical protein
MKLTPFLFASSSGLLIIGLCLFFNACTATEVAASSGTIGGAIVDSMVANHHLTPVDGNIFKQFLQGISDLVTAHSSVVQQQAAQIADLKATSVTQTQALTMAGGGALAGHGISAVRIKPVAAAAAVKLV